MRPIVRALRLLLAILSVLVWLLIIYIATGGGGNTNPYDRPF